MKNHTKIIWFKHFVKNFDIAKSLRIMFDKVDGFVWDYHGTKYLAFFGLEKYNAIYDSIIDIL